MCYSAGKSGYSISNTFVHEGVSSYVLITIHDKSDQIGNLSVSGG